MRPSPRTVAVFTRAVADADADSTLQRLVDVAAAAEVELRLPPEEIEKHPVMAEQAELLDGEVDLAIVLGGDGTILRALREFAGRRVPVFAVNFGEIGFLSTVERDELGDGLQRAIRGDYEILDMPALAIDTPEGERFGVNDISVHRRQESRVATLGYSVAGEGLGRVRCDGIVACTPVGSTGYNLANGGPVLAWGVSGYAVSFIAPHTLTARALVVAPDDVLTIHNLSRSEPVEVTTDGRPVMELAPGDQLDVSFRDAQVRLAQLPGTNFYHRLREKFGRLAQ